MLDVVAFDIRKLAFHSISPYFLTTSSIKSSIFGRFRLTASSPASDKLLTEVDESDELSSSTSFEFNKN